MISSDSSWDRFSHSSSFSLLEALRYSRAGTSKPNITTWASTRRPARATNRKWLYPCRWAYLGAVLRCRGQSGWCHQAQTHSRNLGWSRQSRKGLLASRTNISTYPFPTEHSRQARKPVKTFQVHPQIFQDVILHPDIFFRCRWWKICPSLTFFYCRPLKKTIFLIPNGAVRMSSSNEVRW